VTATMVFDSDALPLPCPASASLLLTLQYAATSASGETLVRVCCVVRAAECRKCTRTVVGGRVCFLCADCTPICSRACAQFTSLNITMPCKPFSPTSPYRFTFADAVDGSAQYAAVIPPVKECPPTGCPVLFSTHGAGVGASHVQLIRTVHYPFVCLRSSTVLSFCALVCFRCGVTNLDGRVSSTGCCLGAVTLEQRRIRF
jgi:hypothetical protein